MGQNTPTKELFDHYVIPTYGRFNLQLSQGKGTWVWSETGQKFLDFGAGIAVTSLGHCHPKVIAKMQEQLEKLVHTSNLYFTRPQGLLAKKLVEIAGGSGKVFFCNSGAEANEALYKLSRKFGNEAVGFAASAASHTDSAERSRYAIVSMRGSFHGRTLAGISATGQDKVKIGFEPMVQGFVHADYNHEGSLIQAVETNDAAAVLIEPVQGESGIHPATKEFLTTARELCNSRSMLLLFDEIQCGLGRTGEWNGWQSIAPDIVPDAISWAKGIAGGFPLGAIWVSNRPVMLKSGEIKPLCDLLGPGTHGTTFGGTPLVCTGALEVISIIEQENLLENARKQGAYALDLIKSLQSPLIKDVRGMGLMIGIEFVPDVSTRCQKIAGKTPSLYVVEQLHAEGLLSVPSGTHTVRWLPPLNVSSDEIDSGVEIFQKVLQKISLGV